MSKLVARVIACMLVCVAACGEGRPPPKAALKPAGQGWYCWRNLKSKNSSRCERTAALCSSSRNSAIKAIGMSAENVNHYGECEIQPNACCFTHKTAAQKDDWWCATTYDDCETTARTLSRDPDQSADYADLSSCQMWE